MLLTSPSRQLQQSLGMLTAGPAQLPAQHACPTVQLEGHDREAGVAGSVTHFALAVSQRVPLSQ